MSVAILRVERGNVEEDISYAEEIEVPIDPDELLERLKGWYARQKIKKGEKKHKPIQGLLRLATIVAIALTTNKGGTIRDARSELADTIQTLIPSLDGVACQCLAHKWLRHYL